MPETEHSQRTTEKFLAVRETAAESAHFRKKAEEMRDKIRSLASEASRVKSAELARQALAKHKEAAALAARAKSSAALSAKYANEARGFAAKARDAARTDKSAISIAAECEKKTNDADRLVGIAQQHARAANLAALAAEDIARPLHALARG